MARQHRSRRHRSRRAQKSQRRRASRRSSRRSSRRTQRGGSSCTAMPLNREAFAQRGGMAPFATLNNGYLLDAATRVQAEVAPIDKAIAELPSVIRTSQAGGARKRRQSRRGRKQRRQSRRKQRGGDLQAFGAPYMLLPPGTPIGANPQFRTEGEVNPLYSEYSGPQA